MGNYIYFRFKKKTNSLEFNIQSQQTYTTENAKGVLQVVGDDTVWTLEF